MKIKNLKIEEDIRERGYKYYVRARFMCNEFEASSILGKIVDNINLNINPYFLPLPVKRPLQNPSYYSSNPYIQLNLDKEEKLWELTASPVGSGLNNGAGLSHLCMIKDIIKNKLRYIKNGLITINT